MHKIDEHVATADLIALTAIYRRILEAYYTLVEVPHRSIP